MTPRQPRSTLFPYTTLFRSQPETQERLRQMLKEELLSNLRRNVPAPSDIAEADVHAYFDAHHDEFKEPERRRVRSEEHTSELQSLRHLVCRLLLEKKNKHTI